MEKNIPPTPDCVIYRSSELLGSRQLGMIILDEVPASLIKQGDI